MANAINYGSVEYLKLLYLLIKHVETKETNVTLLFTAVLLIFRHTTKVIRKTLFTLRCEMYYRLLNNPQQVNYFRSKMAFQSRTWAQS